MSDRDFAVPGNIVRYEEVSAIWDVLYREVCLCFQFMLSTFYIYTHKHTYTQQIEGNVKHLFYTTDFSYIQF